MKKLLSLVLVMVMLFSFCPAAYASGLDDVSPASSPMEDLILYLLKVTNLIYTDGASEGIVKADGHLVSCPGEGCNCLSVLLIAEMESRQLEWEESLKVWIKTSRDDPGQRHELIVAEVDTPYDKEDFDENVEYLEEKEAVRELLMQFVDEDDLGERLYRPVSFITSQLMGSCTYVESERSGGKIHVEYRLMDDDGSMLSVPAIDFAEGKLGERAKNYIFSCDSFVPEGYTVPEFDLHLRAGDMVIQLPDECLKAGFTLALSFNENGAVRILLADDNGKLIPGAAISAALPEDAPADVKAAVLDENGELTVLDDSVVKSGLVVFEAPTGDDVFALSEK